MTLNGWIIYNGFLESDKFFDFAHMLQVAALDRGHHAEIKKNEEIINFLHKDSFTNYHENLPDYVLFTDKDIYLANSLERLGIPVFNRAEAIEISDDKIKTYEKLADADIPIPDTIIAPKTFGIHFDMNRSFISTVIKHFQFPFILKEAFGSFGEQVYLVHNEQELKFYLDKIGGAPFVFQQYIEASHGVDLRLQVVGEEVVAAMKRTSKTDFRANVTSGGKMEPYEPNETEIKLAVRATKAIGAHFAGVDLLLGSNDTRYVCEVNSNAHIRNLYDCTNINVAPFIITMIEEQLKRK